MQDIEKRIKQKINKLKKLVIVLDDERKKAVEELIQNIAFMAVTLEDLQEDIKTNGFSERYQNGSNQWGTKESTAFRAHTSMTKNYLASFKQLMDQLPKSAVQEELNYDELFK